MYLEFLKSLGDQSETVYTFLLVFDDNSMKELRGEHYENVRVLDWRNLQGSIDDQTISDNEVLSILDRDRFLDKSQKKYSVYKSNFFQDYFTI